jgi:hypothetical protein
MKYSSIVMEVLRFCDFCSEAQAPWVQTNGSCGRDQSCLVVSPKGAGRSNLFAGDFIKGVYHATNNGTGWIIHFRQSKWKGVGCYASKD